MTMETSTKTPVPSAEAVRALYLQGLSMAQVAVRLGCTKSLVARRLRAAGVPRRPSGRPFTTPAPVVNVAALVRLREAGRSFPAIAAELELPNDDMARDRYLRATGRRRRAAAKSDDDGTAA